jgi:hypothetical protein
MRERYKILPQHVPHDVVVTRDREHGMTSGSIWLACDIPQASAAVPMFQSSLHRSSKASQSRCRADAIVDNNVTSAMGTVLSSLKASKRQLRRSDVRQEHRHNVRGGKVWVGGLGQVLVGTRH